MQETPFIPPGNFLLQTKALEVPVEQLNTPEIQQIIDQMFAIAKGERRDNTARGMVGLAAPQIGIPLRIILVDTGIGADRKNWGMLVAYINPKIVSYSEELVEGREGCFSVDSRVIGQVPRSRTIQIEALDRYGHPVAMELTDYTARIFQHEVDHLDGIRFPDRVGPSGKLHWVEEEEYPNYKQNSLNWPHLCPWEVWLAMKNGSPYHQPK